MLISAIKLTASLLLSLGVAQSAGAADPIGGHILLNQAAVGGPASPRTQPETRQSRPLNNIASDIAHADRVELFIWPGNITAMRKEKDEIDAAGCQYELTDLNIIGKLSREVPVNYLGPGDIRVISVDLYAKIRITSGTIIRDIYLGYSRPNSDFYVAIEGDDYMKTDANIVDQLNAFIKSNRIKHREFPKRPGLLGRLELQCA